MEQQIIIIIIGIITLAYLAWKIYSLFTAKYDTDTPCASCSGCSLKKDFMNKKVDAKKFEKECPSQETQVS